MIKTDSQDTVPLASEPIRKAIAERDVAREEVIELRDLPLAYAVDEHGAFPPEVEHYICRHNLISREVSG
jgi:hypothetical protein